MTGRKLTTAVGALIAAAAIALTMAPAVSAAPAAKAERLGGKVTLRVDDPRLAAVHTAPTAKSAVVERLPWGHTYTGQLVDGTLWYKIGTHRYLSAGTVNSTSSDHEKLGLHQTLTIVGAKPAPLRTGPNASGKVVDTLPVGTKVTGQLVNSTPWYKVAHGRYVPAANTRVVLYAQADVPGGGNVIDVRTNAGAKVSDAVAVKELTYSGPMRGLFGNGKPDNLNGGGVVKVVPAGKAIAATYVGSKRTWAPATADRVSTVISDYYRVAGGYLQVAPFTVGMDSVSKGAVPSPGGTGEFTIANPRPKTRKPRVLPYDPSGAINAARAMKGWPSVRLVDDPQLRKCVTDPKYDASTAVFESCLGGASGHYGWQYSPQFCTLDFRVNPVDTDPRTGFAHTLLNIGNAATKTVAAVMITQPANDDPAGKFCLTVTRLAQ